MQKLKKILFVVGLLVVLNANLVEAQENRTEDLIEEEENIEKGSIQIILTDGKQGTKKEDVEFQCIKVADLINGDYRIVETYRDMNIEVNTITHSEELDEAAKILAKKEVNCEVKKAGSNGEVVFDDLEVGLYLLKAKETGSYDEVMPVLIAVPTWNEIEKVMEYDVTVVPKHTSGIEQNENKSVQTGDYDDMSMYVLAAGISILSIVYLMMKKRKKI